MASMETKQETSQEDLEKLRAALEALEQYKDRFELTDASVAKRMGISSAQISNWRRVLKGGTYPGDMGAFIGQVWQFLAIRPDRKGAPLRPSFHQTHMATEILSLLHRAHEGGEIGLILGPPGLGKSRTCREYVKNSKAAMHIEVASAFSPSVIISQICDWLGTSAKGSPQEVFAAAWSHLKRKGDQWLIVIDQAHRLSKPALAKLCELWLLSSTEDDTTFTRIGPSLIFVGLEDFYNDFRTKLPEFFDRCSFAKVFMPGEVARHDWKVIIEDCFRANDVEFEGNVIDEMLRYRQTKRSLLNLADSLVRIAQNTNRPVDAVLVRAAVEKVG